jgi:hypothetical protein
VKRIRIHKPGIPREHPWHEILPADPRDPDVWCEPRLSPGQAIPAGRMAVTSAACRDGRADDVRPPCSSSPRRWADPLVFRPLEITR